MPGCVPEDICALVLSPGGQQPTQQLKDAHCAGCGKPCSPAASFSAERGSQTAEGTGSFWSPGPSVSRLASLGQQTGVWGYFGSCCHQGD